MDLKVLGIAGSLRKGSYNRALLRAAASLAPEGMAIEAAEIDSIPLYSGDVEAAGIPAPVEALSKRITTADTLLLVTPEYNYSIPGVLKNAIDWLSRLPASPLNAKPTGIMGASVGAIGTARAQYHLRQVGVFTNMLILNRPEVMVAKAQEKFNEAGELIDEHTRDSLRKFLAALKQWTLQIKGDRAVVQ